jgi:uncharacterized protein YndB with AHSA1/START domain
MATQKTFKRRVRARMTKTGEAYTAARRQLLRKTEVAGDAPGDASAPAGEPAAADLLTSDEAMVKGSGRNHAEWFAMLDAWGATAHNHTQIATWLRDGQGVPGWWAQNITVAYERARGLRARHQMADGYSVGATRTVGADADRALEAFTDPEQVSAWLPGESLTRRPTRAARTARFDWTSPPSRVVVTVTPKGEGRAVVSIAHEKVADAEQAERLKHAWRGWLGDLKAYLERR